MIFMVNKKFPKLTFFIEFYAQNRAPLQMNIFKQNFKTKNITKWPLGN